MEQPGVQQVFFQHIRNNLPAHLSFVDEIAELLDISNDSAYRRIRGEKAVSFDELRILCSHFKISLDQLLYLNSESVIFSGRYADHSNFSFEDYLTKNILGQLEFMNSFEKKELLYLNKDIPIFHFFNFHELAAFKFFFWMKTILQYPMFGSSLFSANEFMDSLEKVGKKIVEEYNKLPSQEIWNIESINSTIHQIEYYKDTRVFASSEDIIRLYDALEATINHIEKQAEVGWKFTLDGKTSSPKSSYKVFVNEFILGDNTLIALLNDTKIAYINHSVINVLWTKDTAFAEHTYQHFQNIIRRSSLISDVGEKERNRFFNGMREKIHHRKKAAEHYS